MKKTLISLTFLSFIAFKFYDAFSDLGISKQQAEELVVTNLTNEYLNLPVKARLVSIGSRAAIVQAMGAFAKSYSQTESFKQQYAEWWKNSEPTKPQTPEAKAAEQKQQEEESKKQQQEFISNMKKQIAETKDVAIKKQLQEALDATIKMQAEMKTQMESPEYQKQLKQVKELTIKMEAEEYQKNMAEYQEKHKKWQADNNPKVLIKRCLEKFLEQTNDVDFNAELKIDNGHKQFVNEEYQQKDNTWKQCFRAGKPAVDAARNFSQEWLKEL
jgi:hypothetical protein